MSSPGSFSFSDKSLTNLIRNALVDVYNNSPAGWHEFECATLSAIAEMSTEIAKAIAAMEEDTDMMDVDDDDDEDDEDDVGSSPGSGGSGHYDESGRPIYRCPFDNCRKAYKGMRTRARHIMSKHPNQPVPAFNDP
ncbi:hypothetical protein ColTof4_12268 [Colletotrichum tofieldiae]|nr:hypothetical protein ColTof3_05676 [Colletotrichum tofieldiae]GKT79845.1 hypothetical protein ColTof4_12268 [Colletotrichum tofieldiae]GKT84415.1 hypothetical protein Ct61P_02265 [Colletotrichum tofieldiae]